jgi:hypothetical protein
MKMLSKLVLAALLLLPIASLSSLYLQNPSLSIETSRYGDVRYPHSFGAGENGVTIYPWNNLTF